MAERTNPHDEFFKYTLGRPEAIRDFIRINHKSYPDPRITFQLLKYMVRIWDDSGGAGTEFVPIVPIVFYHGVRPWRVARNFQSLFKATSQLKPYLPEYLYHLHDLSAFSDDEIFGEVLFRAALLAFKHIYDGDLPEKAPGILALLRDLAHTESGLQHIEAFLRYFAAGSSKMTDADLARAVEAVFPEHGEEIMPTVYEKWVQKGVREGIKEGRQEGRQEGQQEGRQEGRREGRQQGLLEGLELALDIKFGMAGLSLLPELREVKDPSRLEAVKRVLKTAATPDEVRQVYQRASG